MIEFKWVLWSRLLSKCDEKFDFILLFIMFVSDVVIIYWCLYYCRLDLYVGLWVFVWREIICYEGEGIEVIIILYFFLVLLNGLINW